MNIRRRFGVFATAVSGLLVAGLLFSAPAFAWDTELKGAGATCPPGSDQPQVDFTLGLFDTGHSGHVDAFVGDQQVELLNEAGEADNSFSGESKEVKFHFLVPNPDEDTSITLKTVTYFDDLPEGEKPPTSKVDVDVTKCMNEESSSSSSSSTSTTETPTSVGLTTTTEAAGQLPFTGSNSLPILIAALVMLIGGGAALYATRIRGRHAK